MDVTTEFWSEFYSNNIAPMKPSLFAEFCMENLSSDNKLLELGCGNGRDATFFAKNGIDVIACERCAEALDSLNDIPNLSVLNCDFEQLIVTSNIPNLSAIYSRFTLHAINEELASKVLRWSFNKLNTDGKLFIEARSVKDDLYGQGEQVGRNAFVTDHYRRFIDYTELENELLTIGYKIQYLHEDRNFAPYGNENPVLLRVVATKPL